MRQFNLIDEKWIPLRLPDGGRIELGIRDTLLRAREFSSIEDSSPLVVAALHRFLLAVLYRALEGPCDISEAKTLFKEGLPAEKISAYLEKWRDRFWLFDETHPFGQNPNVSKKEIEPWTKLTPEFNATTNKVLFDHTDTRNPGEREPQDCARWLLMTMNFSIAGGRGYFPSPSPNAMMCIPLGQNLAETLCYNLVPYPNREVTRQDSAIWERDPLALPLSSPKRSAKGYADLFTWPSRMILLEECPSGSITVMRFVAGEGFDNSQNLLDPMQAYKADKTYGLLPISFREDRGTWRDFDSIIPAPNENAPKTFQMAMTLAEGREACLPQSILVLGLRYEPPNANLKFWRMERFTLPSALAGDRCIREDIHRFLARAETTQKALWSACNTFARYVIARGERKPDGKDTKAFLAQMPCIPAYWASLEAAFHVILQVYTLDQDPYAIERDWVIAVRDALSSAWYQHRRTAITGDAWTIRSLVKADGAVVSELKKLEATIKEFNDFISKEEA